MTIDNLKAFIAKFTDKHQKSADCKEKDFELEDKLGGGPEMGNDGEIKNVTQDPLGCMATINPDIDIPDLYGPDIPDDEICCVYGPAPEYDDEDLDICDPDAEDIIEKKDVQE